MHRMKNKEPFFWKTYNLALQNDDIDTWQKWEEDFCDRNKRKGDFRGMESRGSW